MDQRDIAAFKRQLVDRREALAEVASSGDDAAGTVELDQTRVGRLSRMDALQAQAMAKESGRRRQLELQRIAAALERIDDEGFGYCLGCGEEIAPARLQFDPAVTLCIDCASASEEASP